MKRYFTEKYIQIVDKHVKICTILLAIRELKLRPIMSYHYMPIRRDKNSDKTKANKENKSYIKILWLFKHIFMYMLLLLSYFSRVRLCVTPQTAAHQAPPSLALSRQEHWSGLPFPSPTQESEK